jgi:hypothetical protein
VKPRTRWTLLLSLLALSAGLVIFSDPPKREADVVGALKQPARPGPAPSPTAAAAQSPQKAARGEEPEMILAIRPRARSQSYADAFALQNWTPPPPPPPPAAPPPPPKAPPLPFTVLGKKLQDGGWQVFLARADRTYIVRDKDVIENDYRVESIAPPSLTLTYLPMNERQTLSIGNAE